MKKKGLNGIAKAFSVDYDDINTSDTLDIYRFIKKKHNIKYCLGLLKKCLSNY